MDGDTTLSHHSFAAAMHAAGSVCQAVDMVARKEVRYINPIEVLTIILTFILISICTSIYYFKVLDFYRSIFLIYPTIFYVYF